MYLNYICVLKYYIPFVVYMLVIVVAFAVQWRIHYIKKGNNRDVICLRKMKMNFTEFS